MMEFNPIKVILIMAILPFVLIVAYMIGRMFGLGIGKSLINTTKQKEKKDETIRPSSRP